LGTAFHLAVTRRYTPLSKWVQSRLVSDYNLKMRWGTLVVAALALGSAAWAKDTSQNLPLLPCPQGSPENVGCVPSKSDLNQARKAFSKGLKLQHENRLEEAFAQFESAAHLVPKDVDYLTAREMVRQQLVYERLLRGSAYLTQGKQVEALADFRSALQLDPQNEFAQQRLRDAAGEWAPKTTSPPQVVASAEEVRVAPEPVRADFHYRGDGRALLSQVATAFGVIATIDDSVVSRQVRFDIQQVDFYTAMRAACSVTRSFWTALEDKQILVALDNPENHRQFDRLAMRTFYLPGVTTPQELTDLVNLLRNLFEIRFLNPNQRSSTIAVRAPERVLDAATRFIETLGDARPQVMLDVKVYQISQTMTRNMGLQIPNNFQLFNIPAGALAALGGQNIQDLINQLIANGGINQATSEAISALLAQQQGQQNSIFSQPLATFGNGLTLMGLSLGTAGAQLSLHESMVKTLEHATMRVAQGNEATFRVGSRFPILNASFAPIFNTAAISRVIQNNSFQAAFPSFNYEDIGLTIKAKPAVSGNLDVRLQLEMQFRSLAGQSINGVPVISNREYKGSINLLNGAPAVVAGSVSRTEQRSMNGIPGLGTVPALNKVMVSNSKELDEDELLVVITPHVIDPGPARETTEVWMTK
jgi:general secretion pathway protein D